MFDRVTAETIRSAPRLKGIPVSRMAAKLTDAYVQVSVANALLDGNPADVDQDLLERLGSIARSQEAISLIAADAETQRAAAYVAARAYQVLAAARPARDVRFTSSSIPTPISSMLLFVASDATPDAEEMARSLEASGAPIESALTLALRSLGMSDFQAVAEMQSPPFVLPDSGDPHEIAAYVGYFQCFITTVEMCRALLLASAGDWEPGAFAVIRESLGGTFAVGQVESAVQADDTILGPWHLASLLDLAEQVLFNSALTRVAAPAGVEESAWAELVGRISKRRPTLWRNHREAVSAGFLSPGTSAVVTFPTGAGKSTVTELKVAATVLSGKNVVFLVPTLSLLDQQATALRSTLHNHGRVVAQRDFEDDVEFLAELSPTTFVLTPESCLALFSADATAFGDVGLIVFDEAHLLAASGDVPTRRALDATLCLLILARRFDEADIFLVSAMIGNAHAMSDWLAAMTGRNALALDDPWKPTRQARGAVIYRAEEIERLNSLIQAAQLTRTTDGPPSSLVRQMDATPHGFFGLLTTWQSTRSQDYRMLPLLPAPARLTVSGKISGSGWHLTGNANQTASAIARAGASSGRKVLVFTQQVGWAVSVSKEVNADTQRRTQLKRAEVALLARAVESAGANDALYGEFDGESVIGESLPHHGLLLREERRLHESIYRRPDGVPVLVATSTLAQGMNLPSEIVVIAGDRRFDSESNRPQRLEAQELLNAAGRAGRAGMKSNGLVVVVPSYPIAYDGARQMGATWFELQSVFSQADQCVDVVDAITSLLNAEPTELSSAEIGYLSRRLAESEDPRVARDLVNRGFGAFMARRDGTEAALDRRLAEALIVLDSDAPVWLRSVIASTGLPAEDIEYIGRSLEGTLPSADDLIGWREWVLTLYSGRPNILTAILRSGSQAIFRGAPAEIGAEWQRLEGEQLVEAISPLLTDWMSGSNLQELEQRSVELGLTRRSTQRCEFARKFVLRVVPDLAYAFGLPWLIAKRRGLDESYELELLRILPTAVELGVDSIAKLDYLQASVLRTRIGTHQSVR